MSYNAVQQLIGAGARIEAERRCLCIGIAVNRFQLRHGKNPAASDELAKEFFTLPASTTVKQTITDPFDGQPMRTRIDDRGFCIYSIGPNQIDDGGQLKPGDPPNHHLPLDLGYCVPLMEPADD